MATTKIKLINTTDGTDKDIMIEVGVTTVQDVLNDEGISGDSVQVAVKGQPIDSDDYDETVLCASDRITVALTKVKGA